MKLCAVIIASLLVCVAVASSSDNQKEFAQEKEMTREETQSLGEHEKDDEVTGSEERSCIEEWKTCENDCECCGMSTLCAASWVDGHEIKLCRNEGGKLKKVLHFIQKSVSKIKSCKK
uniref:Hainantoxin-XV-4 n=1 Tax=Cyriopagopus hainanus TaxID=2781057 RepID=TX32F_CYRHA|nr:RecName: Full=Hainantoxin-XV-4; Short=HNTX-XV-4; Flags: Precursor [Haplopelma hainanum]ADB56831.1 HNTX-XV-4 precursor [Haplopelma hainanum]